MNSQEKRTWKTAVDCWKYGEGQRCEETGRMVLGVSFLSRESEEEPGW